MRPPTQSRDGEPSTRRAVLKALGALGTGSMVATAGCLSHPQGEASTDEKHPATDVASGTPTNLAPFVKWTYSTPHESLGGLDIVAADPPEPALVFGSAGGGGQDRVYALTLQGGEKRWRARLPGPVEAPPVSGDRDGDPRLYLPTGSAEGEGEGTLQAFHPANGRRVWQRQGGGGTSLVPLGATGSAVFVGRRDGTVRAQGESVTALGAADGSRRWQVDSGDVARGGHAVHRDRLYLKTRASLRALGSGTGNELWRLDGDGRLLGPVYEPGAERVYTGRGSTVTGHSTADASELWRRDFGFAVSAVTAPRESMGTAVFVGDASGRLLALSPLSGETRWTVSVDRASFIPVVRRTSESLFLGGAGVHALDPVSGDRTWSFTPDVEGPMDVHASTTVFAFAPGADILYALDPASGDVRWQFDPDGDVTGVVTAGDFAFATVGGTVYALHGHSETESPT